MSTLLYAVVAMRVQPAGESNWFRRVDDANGCLISTYGDVLDVLLTLPETWNIVQRARLTGLHDDNEIIEEDLRFSQGDNDSAFAVIAHADGQRYIAMVQVGAVEAVFFRRRIFKGGTDIEACLEK